MATGQTQTFGPWTARSHGPTRSACSSDRGIHPEAADALHEQQAKAPEPSPEKKMTMTRSKTSPPDFMLASGKNGSGMELRHDPRAQRDRMNLFKRQLAANRTRGTEEVMKRNRAQTLQQKASGGASDHPSKDSFVTRSVVDALRDERGAVGKGGEGEAVTTLTGLGGEGKGTQLPIAAENWPFVYFVVALDQMPVASEDMADLKVGKPHTARERQRVQAARKRRIQQSREELERIRESNIDMGLRLEPIRPATRTPHTPHTHHTTTPTGQDQVRQRMNASKHPPTPISSESLQDFPMHRGTDYFLNNGEQLSMEDMMCRGFSQWFSDNFSTASNSQPGSRPGGEIAVEGSAVGKTEKPEEPSPGQNASGASSVQLPDIAQEQGGKKKGNAKPKDHHGKAQPTSNGPPESGQAAGPNNKKVHFAEGLPYIKGSGLQLPQNKQEPDSASRPLTTPYVSKTAGGEGFVESFPDMLQPPWSAPVMSRSLPAMTPKSKNCRPLPMPKIDIVSEIYDELIVKTIQSFLAREGYSEAKFANLRKKIMARLSATYPHLAAHRAWKMSHRESGIHPEGQGPLPTETDERSRLRLRPLHQGFFAKDPKLDIASGDFVRETSLLGDLTFPPHSSRQISDFVRPRWVPVMPMYRSYSSLRPEDEEAYSRGAFMAIDGRHIVFTPREDLPFKTATLPGATSDFRMGPLTLPDDSRPAKTWTHIIPNAVDE